MPLEALLADYGNFEPNLPEIAGKYQGRNLIICGDAACIWDDLERFGARCDVGRGSVKKDGWDIMTINKMVEVFPGDIEHAYSNEPTLLLKFVAARRSEYTREFEGPKHTHAIMRGAKWHWPFGGHGTSGLGSTLVGLALGYGKIVLCGVPLDNGPHNGEPYWRKCRFEDSEAAGTVAGGPNGHWKRALTLGFDGRVTSMSGRTREWLGAPAEC